MFQILFYKMACLKVYKHDLRKEAAICKNKLDILIKSVEQIVIDGDTSDIELSTEICQDVDEMISKLKQQKIQLLQCINRVKQEGNAEEKAIVVDNDRGVGTAASMAEQQSGSSINKEAVHVKKTSVSNSHGDISSDAALTKDKVLQVKTNAAESHKRSITSVKAMTKYKPDEVISGRNMQKCGSGDIADMNQRTSVANPGPEENIGDVVSKISLHQRLWLRDMVVIDTTLWVASQLGNSSHHRDSYCEGGRQNGVLSIRENIKMKTSLLAYQIPLLNEQPQEISMDGIDDIDYPANMARFPSQNTETSLVLSYYAERQLLFIELEYQAGDRWRINSHRLEKLEFQPLGLGMHKGELMVSDPAKKFHIKSTSSGEWRTVDINTVSPRKAVFQPTSHAILVMDRENKLISSWKDNVWVWTYRGQDGFRPGDIACHGKFIYVSDNENSCVYELSADGDHVRTVAKLIQTLF